MLAENLPIYVDAFELANMLLSLKNNINRDVKFSEYTDMCKYSRDVLSCIYLANRDVVRRYDHLNDVLMHIFNIKAIARLLRESCYLTTKQNNRIQQLIENITKQTIGWRGTTTQKARVKATTSN